MEVRAAGSVAGEVWFKAPLDEPSVDHLAAYCSPVPQHNSHCKIIPQGTMPVDQLNAEPVW